MTLPDDNERGRPDGDRTTSRSDGEKLKPTLTPLAGNDRRINGGEVS